MVLREVMHKGHIIQQNHNGLWTILPTMQKFDTLKKAKLFLREYRYEWAAYTDNLCYGRIKIAQNSDKNWVRHMAENSGKGCYVIERVRVLNID